MNELLQFRVPGRVVAAEAGLQHSVVLLAEGQVMVTGSNQEGQLGCDRRARKEPVYIPLRGLRAAAVACGNNYSLVMTQIGEVFSFGENKFGQLGVGDCASRRQPTKLKARDVLAVRAGSHHSALLTAAGILVCGDNSYGQLAADSPCLTLPTKLPFSAQDIFLGNDFTYLAHSGHLYGFGRNDFGQLGLGHSRKVEEPVAIPAMARQKVVELRSRESTVVLLEDGGVFVWGEVAVQSSQPKYIRPEKGVFRKIAAGLNFLAAVSSERELFFWSESHRDGLPQVIPCKEDLGHSLLADAQNLFWVAGAVDEKESRLAEEQELRRFAEERADLLEQQFSARLLVVDHLAATLEQKYKALEVQASTILRGNDKENVGHQESRSDLQACQAKLELKTIELDKSRRQEDTLRFVIKELREKLIRSEEDHSAERQAMAEQISDLQGQLARVSDPRVPIFSEEVEEGTIKRGFHENLRYADCKDTSMTTDEEGLQGVVRADGLQEELDRMRAENAALSQKEKLLAELGPQVNKLQDENKGFQTENERLRAELERIRQEVLQKSSADEANSRLQEELLEIQKENRQLVQESEQLARQFKAFLDQRSTDSLAWDQFDRYKKMVESELARIRSVSESQLARLAEQWQGQYSAQESRLLELQARLVLER